tara:strand:- start:1321 stop:1701 length:381 start_codon:yes stop_codon:yes gene_type:complete
MSKGLSPKLPLSKNPVDGYSLNKTYKEMIIQNLKMLVLTAPGERIMEPSFGVGLRNYLFLNDDPKIRADISSKIDEQVKKYMPFVEVLGIDFNQIENQENSLFVGIRFKIIPIDVVSYVEINTQVN